MSSELHEALQKDPSEAYPLVRKLLDEGAAVNERSTDELLTPLHQAAKSQDRRIVELLLDKGADIDARDGSKMPPLMVAVCHGQLENCKVLLERGADTSLRAINGASILELAVRNEYPAIVRLLLEYGVDINTRERVGGTVLISAIMIDEATYLGGMKLRRYGDSFSTTKLEIMRLLIDNSIDIEARLSDGTTALHSAALVGDNEAIKILLDAGANPNVVDDCNRKPLWAAVRENNVESVKLLLKRTTDINDQVYNGHTCLSTAARWGHEECVKLLLEAGAEIWCQAPGPQFLEPERRLMWYGCDALGWAVDGGHLDVVELILRAGTERQPESIADGVYAEWLEVWDRGNPEELRSFREWINRRIALSETPELEALRAELVEGVYRMDMEKRREIGEQIGLCYEEAEDEEETEGQNNDRKDEEDQEKGR